MNENGPNLKDFQYNFEKSEEILRKKLFRKVYFIVTSMVLVLTAIIIIEFKEYSFNSLTEYKIGKGDLGPRDLVWAGIMGTPPSYYESDKKYGFGIKEFETREIRKALEEAGFNIIYRYMSPNRLEFEFVRKHPLCFYDRKWNNPKHYFKTVRPEILSIPLNYSGREPKKIFFRKEDKSRFLKHLDEKGNLILDSLIKDTSLKTELVRAVDYDGPYSRENITYGKKQLDGTYYDYVKNKYAKNIDLAILHTNDQLIQMLGRKRFDYQFLHSLEYDDYPWIEGGKNRIDTLIYEVRSINNIDEPGLIFHSVACGNHPLIKQAMPIINNVIKRNRVNEDNHNRIVKYARKLDPLSKIYETYIYSIKLQLENISNADSWYDYQFFHFKNLAWPKFNSPVNPIQHVESKVEVNVRKRSIPQWNLIIKENEKGDKTLLVIHDTDIKNKEEETRLTKEFLEKSDKFIKRYSLDNKENFKDLNFSKVRDIQNVIIFARGITDHEFPLLNPLYRSLGLKGLTLIEGSLKQSHELLSNISPNIELFRFFDVPIIGTPIGETVKKLKHLKSFALHSDSIFLNRLFTSDRELLAIIKSVPSELEEFSLSQEVSTVYDLNWFPDDFGEIFRAKKFNKLKFLQLKNFSLDEVTLKLLLDSVPLELESLIIGSTLLFGNVSSLLLEEFLKKRYFLNKLKLLRVTRMLLSPREDNKMLLPKSLEDLAIILTTGNIDNSFDRMHFHPEMRLKNLNLSQNNLTDFTIKRIFNYLSPQMGNLILSKNRITGKIFTNKNAQRVKSIENLKLDSNLMNDQGLVNFSQLPWSIKKLDLSDNSIMDNSLSIFSAKNWPGLSEIDLSENHLSEKYINYFLKMHLNTLTSLKLRNVLSIDTKYISQYMSKKLEVLDLSGNLLNDEQIMYLAPKLPKNLISFNIGGSRMGVKGALELAKYMPNLTQFFWDFKPGEQEEGLRILLSNLSPFLTKISPLREPLSYSNAKLLSKYMPHFLREFVVPELEREECKILLSSFSNGLRYLDIKNDIKSQGNSLQELTQNFPSHLSIIYFGETISKVERDFFIEKNQDKISLFWNGNNNNKSSAIFLKILSRYLFLKFGNFSYNDFKSIIYPPVIILKNITPMEEINKFFLSSHSDELKYIKYLMLEDTKLETNALISFLRKLPQNIQAIGLKNSGIKLEDVDKIIEVLPKNLRRLNISENPFGEKGLIKFREFKRKMEEKTGLPFDLAEITVTI